MKVNLIDQKGKKVKDIELNKEVFGVEPNEKVISQYIYSYLSNQRQSNAQTKDRSEVSGGGKKPHKQKGTGRARSGSSRNPLWRKGGVIFGPTNDRNWTKKMNKKFKKTALKNIISKLVKENRIVVLDKLNLKSEKLAKQASDFKNLVAADLNKITLVTNEKNEMAINAFSNIQNARVVLAQDLNGYDLYTGGKIVLEEPVVKTLETRLEKK